MNQTPIELFPSHEIFAENVDEDKPFIFTEFSKKQSELWSATERGSVRIATNIIFSTEEYSKLKKEVLSKELP